MTVFFEHFYHRLSFAYSENIAKMTSHKTEPMQHANALPNTKSPIVAWLEQYGNAATAVACVAMIGGAIWFSYHRTTSARNEAAWASFSQARTAEDFANIADSFKTTEVAHWSRLSEGERLLDSGLNLMYTDREGALGDLTKADEAFRAVVGAGSAPAAARERAAWGLAKSTESQSDGDTAKATEAYQALLSAFPKSVYKSAAEERIEALKTPAAKEFYAWFHKQNPKPADRKKPTDGLPPGHPPIGTSPKDDLLDDSKPETSEKDDKNADGEKSDDKKSDEVKKPEAKDKKKSDSGESAAKKTSDEQPKTILDGLNTKTDLAFNRTPLQDAISTIAKSCGVTIEIDGDGLKLGGFTKNMPQTVSLEQATGLQGLAAILKRYESEKNPIVLVVDEAQNKAVITTAEAAKKNNQTPFVFPKAAADQKTDSQPPKTDADKPKGESKDAPAESK